MVAILLFLSFFLQILFRLLLSIENVYFYFIRFNWTKKPQFLSRVAPLKVLWSICLETAQCMTKIWWKHSSLPFRLIRSRNQQLLCKLVFFCQKINAFFLKKRKPNCLDGCGKQLYCSRIAITIGRSNLVKISLSQKNILKCFVQDYEKFVAKDSTIDDCCKIHFIFITVFCFYFPHFFFSPMSLIWLRKNLKSGILLLFIEWQIPVNERVL